MEKVLIADKEFFVYPLTRGQIRRLKEFGFSNFLCRPSIDQASDAMDAVFDLVLSETEKDFLDDRPIKDSFTIWKAILSETYGGGDDEKNLNGTSDGGSTEIESNTATAVVPEKQI